MALKGTADLCTIHIDDPAFLSMLHFILRVTPNADGEPAAEVADLWATARRGDVRLSPIFAHKDAEYVEAAVATVSSPGAASLLLLSPPSTKIPPDKLALCLKSARMCVLDCGDKLTEVLLDSADRLERGWHEPLRQAGFCFLTNLIYLFRPVDAAMVEPALPTGVSWLNYTARDETMFLRALEESYVGTLDCPELTGIRTTAEVLAGHRAAGEFDPALWTLAMRGGEPVGVVLVNPLRNRTATEITYLGVAQTVRGTGVAHALTAHAIVQSRKVSAKTVALAVDVRNTPARRLYARWGFQRLGEREVWIAASAQVPVNSEVGIF